MISGAAETKYSGKNIWDNVGFNSSIGSGDFYGILPAVTQGVGSFQRSGKSITPKGLRFKGIVAISSGEADSLSLECRLLVLSPKSAKSYYALNQGSTKNTFVNNMIDFGNGTKIAYDGTTPVHLMPVNTDLFRVHADKKIKLTSSYGATADEHSSHDPLRYAHFDIKVKTPTKLIYEDDIDTEYPTNFAPIVCLGFCVPASNATYAVTTPVHAHAQADLYYDDE